MPNRPGNVTNPKGIGGFKDNPENRSPGGWNKEESISYWYNKIGRMSDDEIAEFKPANQNQRIALVRIERSKRDDKEALAEAKEITDRTEGKSKESIDITTDGESLNKVRQLSDDELEERLKEYMSRGKNDDK